MDMLGLLKSWFGRKSLRNREDLQQFLESRSAYLVQKSIAEYAQARANMMFSVLLGESEFQQAYETARWQSFPAGLAMVAEIMAGQLRSRLGFSAQEAEVVLETLAGAVIEKMKGHGPLNDAAWSQARCDVASDLARASLAQPRPAMAIAQNRSRTIFEALPFHQAIRKHDFAMFRNTLAFHLTEVAAEFEEAALAPGLARLPAGTKTQP
jgi:hypothetical protein